MWLGTMGITGLSGGHVQSALAGLLLTLAATFGWKFRRAGVPKTYSEFFGFKVWPLQ
jgi:hypothetical protein